LSELILLVFALVILLSGLLIKNVKLLGSLAIIAVMACAVYLLQSSGAPVKGFSGLILNDSFSRFFKEIILIVVFLVVLISMGSEGLPDRERGEYYFLLLFTAIAMMLAVSADNFLMIYIALEMISLISYVLVGFLKHDRLSSEGALKYFLFGTSATGIMLYGISFIYGLFGTTNLTIISEVLARGNVNIFAVTIALVLIFAGIGFKCSVVPFHMWVPDTYEGAPTPVAGFLSVGPKAVGFALLLRIFLKTFVPLFPAQVDLFTLIAILTMTFGNVIAFSQPNIKRMLGYSSIAQAGYILIGVIASSVLGKTAALFYLFVYALMNLGAFGCVVLISNSIQSNDIKDYRGLYKKDPVACALLTIFLLSLAGLPPLGGFLAKFLVFAGALEAKLVLLVIAGIINSVVALYYYLRVIKYMYLEEPVTQMVLAKSSVLRLALFLAAAGILIAGIWPFPLLSWAAAAVR